MKDQIRHALSDKATKEEVQKVLIDLINSKSFANCFSLYISGVCDDDNCFICATHHVAEQLQKEEVIK